MAKSKKAITEGRIEKMFKTIEADIKIEEGRIYFMTEDSSDWLPLDEAITDFNGMFCKVAITNQVKFDSLDAEAKPVEE